MIHVCIRSLHGTLLFHTWVEARALWDRLVARVRFRALLLMPDHVHIAVPDESAIPGVVIAMRAFALWRNASRRETGPVWEVMAEPTPVRGREHAERTLRYIFLNACRKHLVSDPLAWPFSSYRDLVGLALPAASRRAADPERFHAFVSGDPSVDPGGTMLPQEAVGPARNGTTPEAVFAAVSALTRTPRMLLQRRGPARTLYVCAARAITRAPSVEIASVIGVDSSTVRHVANGPSAQVRLVERVLGDPRFALLGDGDLRAQRSWCEYRRLR